MARVSTAMLFTFLGVLPTRGDLEPAWTWKSDQTIEWCIPLGEPKECAVAIGLKDGAVRIINIITAAPRMQGDLKGKPGIRFAGESGGTAYFFDLYSVAAASVTDTFDGDEPRDRVRWTIGSDADVNDRESGDPEFIEKLVDAVATPAGVAVLNSSGKVAELNREAGSIRWKADLGSGANGALRLEDGTLCAVVKAAGGFEACFFDLKQRNPAPMRRAIGRTEPMWQALGRDGLVAAWPGRVTRTSAEKDADRLGLKIKFPIRAALLALDLGETPRGAARRERLITLDAAGDLASHEVDSEATAWRSSTRALGAIRPSRLALAGGLAILADDAGPIAAYHTADGRLAAAWTGAGSERVLGVTATARYVHALRIAVRIEGSRRTRELQLIRTPIVRQGEWKKEDATGQQAAEWLGPAAGVRECVWSPGRVLVVSDKLVRMFVLPAE